MSLYGGRGRVRALSPRGSNRGRGAAESLAHGGRHALIERAIESAPRRALSSAFRCTPATTALDVYERGFRYEGRLRGEAKLSGNVVDLLAMGRILK